MMQKQECNNRCMCTSPILIHMILFLVVGLSVSSSSFLFSCLSPLIYSLLIQKLYKDYNTNSQVGEALKKIRIDTHLLRPKYMVLFLVRGQYFYIHLCSCTPLGLYAHMRGILLVSREACRKAIIFHLIQCYVQSNKFF